MESIYLEKIKNFLDSGTTEAKITKVALAVIVLSASPGVVLIAASLGNVVKVFSMFKKSKKYSKTQIKSAMTNLRRQKFIEYVSDKNGVTVIKLTKKGKTKLKSFAIDLIQIKKPRYWDGKWRLVIFDLPIKYTKARNSLRFKLKQLGFIQFQKSVWIYPYPCLDEILFISDYYKIGRYVEVLEIYSFLNENKFKKSFKL